VRQPSESVELSVAGLRVGYQRRANVVDDVDLLVAANTLTALLGPSGCGKTTMLKTVAGLIAPESGDIRIGGASVLDLPAERRPVGLVFQKPLLFGHLSVGDNVSFGLRMRGVPKPARRLRAAEMLDLVGLSGLAGRRVGELSGGQEQRVALARALVLDPKVLLLDEPFSQLDADLRSRMRDLLRSLQRQLAITTLFVTHDQQEAVEVADEIALMLDGRIEAHGAPSAFYTAPATLRAARFFGATNEIPGTLSGTEFCCPLGTLQVAPGSRDGPGVLIVRPEALRLGNPAPATSEQPNTLPVKVIDVRYRGTHQSVRLRCSAEVALTATAAASLRLEVGEELVLRLPPDSCRVFPAVTGPASENVESSVPESPARTGRSRS
jgi:ABC-type Fe3+/spermidine/putrescine transport system ATPase subunit